jgi:universal stress protein A
MPRKPASRVVRAVADGLLARDRLQMRVIDALLPAAKAGEPRPNRSPRHNLKRADEPAKVSMTRAKRWAGFRSVLCPIDFSEQSRQALRYAEAIALRGKAALRVVYVNDPLLIAAAAVALNDRQLARRSALELREFISATIPARSRARLRVKSEVSIGNPPDEILKAAGRGRTDLIVLGTHGITAADRLLVGSTTLGVLQRATVPVLAVPSASPDLALGPSPSWPGGRVLAALELDGDPIKDVDIAAHIAEWFGASLLLVHVVGDIAAPAWLKGDMSAHDRIRVATARQQLERLAARSQKHAETAVRVVCGRVADEIAAVAATERAELLIAALRDRRGWFGARRGSISYHVLSHAVTPVLAYPTEWRLR